MKDLESGEQKHEMLKQLICVLGMLLVGRYLYEWLIIHEMGPE